MTYDRDPAQIEAQTRAIIDAEAQLDRLPPALHPLATAIIAASGMADLADDLAFSADIVEVVGAALASGAPLLCDSEMVAAGIDKAFLPAANEVIVTRHDPRAAMLATRLKTTREAAAVVLWRDRLAGSVVVIGEAPTALFNLMERLGTGWPKPAAILAFPAGFVGAVESKAALATGSCAVPYLTLQGRRGGPAMACAAINALAKSTG